MSAKQIGQQLVQLCKQGKNSECVNSFYAADIESIEAAAPPNGGERVTRGIDNVRAKGSWWAENNEVHSAEVEGPFPHGSDRFAVIFRYDVTFKPAKQRRKLNEVGVFTVKDDKIVREEFYYDMG